jgi:hypothetical protein
LRADRRTGRVFGQTLVLDLALLLLAVAGLRHAAVLVSVHPTPLYIVSPRYSAGCVPIGYGSANVRGMAGATLDAAVKLAGVLVHGGGRVAVGDRLRV